MSSPLRGRRDYGSVNPYLNTPPTKLKRDLESEKDPTKKQQMRDALNAWRITVPGPFRRNSMKRHQIARELLSLANELGIPSDLRSGELSGLRVERMLDGTFIVVVPLLFDGKEKIEKYRDLQSLKRGLPRVIEGVQKAANNLVEIAERMSSNYGKALDLVKDMK